LIGYVDTSAFVPLLIREPSSAACRRFWEDADSVASSRLLYVETAAALAQARRMGRLTARAHRASLNLLDELWPELDIIEVGERVIARAAALAHTQGLRGYDALHSSSAEQIVDDDLVAAAGDRRLLDAWSALGIAVFDTNAPETPDQRESPG
jgi:predicted nucleic acid-binding protein